MKKLLIPIVALLAFSILITSVSANNGEYYAVRFHGSANGCCWVLEEELGPEPPEPTASGRGRFHIRGLAIAMGGPDVYGAAPAMIPNTLVHTSRTYLRVSWDSETVMVHLWPSDYVYAMFSDTNDTFMIMNMNSAGYYIGEAGLQHIRGNATIWHGLIGEPQPILASIVMLYIGTEHFLTFAWVGEEIPELPPGCVARSISHMVTAWPIEWHPIAIL